MPFKPPDNTPRCAVVDLGSNSVRLVVYEGHRRNPVAIFNEKAVLRLGRGLQATGRLNDEGMGQALTVLHRYYAVARAMRAETSLAHAFLCALSGYAQPEDRARSSDAGFDRHLVKPVDPETLRALLVDSGPESRDPVVAEGTAARVAGAWRDSV